MNYIVTTTNKKVTLPERGYFTKGDHGEDIMIIASFITMNFIGYEYKTKCKIDDVLGEWFGSNLEAWIKEFQRNNNLEADGNIGPITLGKLKEYGLE